MDTAVYTAVAETVYQTYEYTIDDVLAFVKQCDIGVMVF